jgi:integrase
MPSGAKAWSFRFRKRSGKPTRKSLGPYPEVRLASARADAASLREKVRRGQDVTKRDDSTFGRVVERWQRRQERQGRRSATEARRILNLHVLPDFEKRAVADIRRRDVIELLERLSDEKGLTAQVNRVQRTISSVLGYAVDADLIEANPLAGLKPQVAEQERKRVLALPELSTVWRSAEALSPIPRAVARLLTLTPQRREEVTAMSWPEIDFDHERSVWREGGLWRIPADRSKSKREQLVPLTAPVREIIAAQPRGEDGDFIFSVTNGQTSFAGWRRAAGTLSGSAELDAPWVLHDLRRSIATGMGELLDIDEGIIARALGHSPRTRMGVTARYERSTRLEQLREALDAWAKLLLDRVAADEGRNVIALPAGVRA